MAKILYERDRREAEGIKYVYHHYTHDGPLVRNISFLNFLLYMQIHKHTQKFTMTVEWITLKFTFSKKSAA